MSITKEQFFDAYMLVEKSGILIDEPVIAIDKEKYREAPENIREIVQLLSASGAIVLEFGREEKGVQGDTGLIT